MEIRLAEVQDLDGISRLSSANLKTTLLNEEDIKTEGYVTWQYPVTLLQKLHQYHPSVVAFAEKQIVGYALIVLREARVDHPEFDVVLDRLDPILYKEKPLGSYNYYAMGQVCVAKNYRGEGVFRKLFETHKKQMQGQYEFVVTTIAVGNPRSIRAHEAVGFKIIHEFDDHFGNWIVVVWDWN